VCACDRDPDHGQVLTAEPCNLARVVPRTVVNFVCCDREGTRGLGSGTVVVDADQ
jgi:hypothetical protein